MAKCPDCRLKVPAWRAWTQVRWSTFRCSRCNAHLRLNRSANSLVAGVGIGILLLVGKPLFHENVSGFVALMSGIFVAVLFATAVLVPAERVSPDDGVSK